METTPDIITYGTGLALSTAEVEGVLVEYRREPRGHSWHALWESQWEDSVVLDTKKRYNLTLTPDHHLTISHPDFQTLHRTVEEIIPHLNRLTVARRRRWF